MSEYLEAPDYIPLSHLNACAYCPRRFYYEFVVGEMVVNEHVFEGQQLHERVDQPGSRMRDEKELLRHLYLCAPTLGLIGYCDLVEVERDERSGLLTQADAHKTYPVEYKKGKMGKWLSDHVQLCAQALALEEVLAWEPGSIQKGYLFYIGSARRDEVAIDETLRERTRSIIAQARSIALQATPPLPITNWKKCRDCSLEPICLPREVLTWEEQKLKGEKEWRFFI